MIGAKYHQRRIVRLRIGQVINSTNKNFRDLFQQLLPIKKQLIN